MLKGANPADLPSYQPTRYELVVNTKVLRSVPLLDQAALDAVREWQFTPTLLNGSPVPVIMTVTVNFTLK